ncbi:AAA family ATPase [Serratia marcescens]|uniref:AAA family ATPase n=1 Tax=Serratia marcescens TaxID=615 RepID=UPI0006ED20AF|nr:AAA family ATPase [Serratia marcescens]ALL37152.1 ATPase [Serratia marcescens]MDT0207682.1 AAA family ATPase [Serratia marcescens]PHI53063.1 ATPase [Serratia marcescens]UJA55651.1 AAA family ATPase [Serratia marcescens]CAI0690745.1 recombination protein F [Serratia marcescens]
MHIKEITLTNFRGAKSITLQCDEHMNILAGMNGAGKSTLLDASAITLSWLVNRMRSLSASARPINDQDIHNGDAYATIEITCQYEQSEFKWNLAKVRKGHSRKEISSALIGATELAKTFQKKITDHDGKVKLPLFAYYPINRAVLDIPLRIRTRHEFNLLDAYEGSLTSGANFRSFFELFREREDLENENRKYLNEKVKPEGYEFPDHQLEAIREALSQFMPDFSNLTVRRNPLRMEIEKNGQCLTVNQLSDGEKCLMAMIGDLAMRMAIANPILNNPLEGNGIILIDEIDLHLHPKWQRMLIPRLEQVFPNCQFIVSTHSPHIITHVKPAHLHLLKVTDNTLTIDSAHESYGKSVDRVLEDIMGIETTRPTSVYESFKTIYLLIQNGELESASKRIDELKEEIGDDPDLVKAEVLIKRKELIGK